MGFLAAVVFGLVSYTNLPLNLMPDLDYPTLTVRTEFEGAAPGEVETQVSRPLEEALSTVPGLVSLESISRAGVSDVILEFEWNSDMADLAQAVRERLGLLELPDEAKRPLVLRYDPNLDPILRLSLSGGDSEDDLIRLRRIADEEVRRAIETLPGVAAVKVRGGLEREVTVEVHEGLLHARGFTLADVIERLAQENINLAGGSLLEGQTEYLIRTLNEFRGPEDIQALYLFRPDGGFARISDFATVAVRAKEREVVGRAQGREAVEIAVYREADANIVSVSRAVRAAVFGTATQRAWVEAEKKAEAELAKAEDEKTPEEEAKEKEEKKTDKKGARRIERAMTAFLAAQLPDDLTIASISDQARFIEAAIASVLQAAWFGALLAVLVLYVFLRHIWSTLVIASAIPISVVCTFAPMYLFDVSLNLMSLGGLALSIGMLVDNSIVVLESVHRCREDGDSPLDAAVRGTSEVAGAVLASTLTTVAVFFPIVFVTGVAGQLFGDLALTVVFGLLASLAVALFLIPVLAALPEKVQRRGPLAAPRIDVLAVPRETKAALFGLPSFVRRGGLASRPPRLVAALVAVPIILLRGLIAGVSLGFVALGFALFGALLGGVGWLFRRVTAPFRGIASSMGGGFARAFESVESTYERALARVLPRASWVLLAALVLLAGSLHLGRGLGSELIPEVKQGTILVHVRLPVGTPLARTLEVTASIEERVRRLKGVETVFTAAGVEATVGAATDRGENTADLTVQLSRGVDLIAGEQKVRAGIREIAASVPTVEVELSSPTLFSFRTPLEVEVRGRDLGDLRIAADAAVVALARLPGLRDVRSNLQAGYPEVRIRYRRDKLARYELDLATVARAVRDKVAGNVATDLRGDGKRMDVRVILREEDRRSVDDLRRLNVNPRGLPPIALSSVADLISAEGPSEIRRSDQSRAALVSAELEGFDLGSAARAVDAALAKLQVPDGITFEVGGQSQEMESSAESLKFALLLAIFLVYVIMAGQFESVTQPLVILLALPLALVGVVPTLALGGVPVSVVVLIGAIVLAGVVVNNAIVLLDYANHLRRTGRELDDAIRTAARVRLRPILISTLTTVLGLMPMVLSAGEGSEIRRPLAITVIAGLSSATLLTLGVIPVFYRAISVIGKEETA
jgi:HAE1 family hydrophobic/amphiphilic exporter-1